MKFSSTFKFWYQRTVHPTCFSQLRSPHFRLFTTVCGVSVCRWRGASKARLVLSYPCTLVLKDLHTCALSQFGVLWWNQAFTTTCTQSSVCHVLVYWVTSHIFPSIPLPPLLSPPLPFALSPPPPFLPFSPSLSSAT